MDNSSDIPEQNERAQQKQLSRDRDAARLASGEVGAEQLKLQNNFFWALPIKRFKIVVVGGNLCAALSDCARLPIDSWITRNA